MAAPAVQYATMPDGGRVAYSILGSGPAVALLFPYHVNHLTLNWQVPLHRGAMQFLARHFTVITLDFRGAGLSDPLGASLTLDLLSTSLDAVVATAGFPAFDVCAVGAAGLIACHYAARAPHRIGRIAFIGSGESVANRRLLHMRHATPDIEATLRGALLGGVGDKGNATALAEVARASLGPRALEEWEALLERERVLPAAAAVAVPCLYLHAEDDHLVPRAAAAEFVANLGDGTLLSVPGRSPMDIWRDRGAVRELVAFLAGANRHVTPGQRERVSPGRASLPAGLSAREVDVLRLLAQGRTNRQIADDLFISLNTVSYHVRNIFAKIAVSNRTEAAAFAFECGLAARG